MKIMCDYAGKVNEDHFVEVLYLLLTRKLGTREVFE